MKHEFVNYSEEEREEFLARAKLLEHEWEEGDWFWDAAVMQKMAMICWTGEKMEGDYWSVYWHEGQTRSVWTEELAELIKQAIWLPTIDDLIKHEEFNLDWLIQPDEWNSKEHCVVGPEYDHMVERLGYAPYGRICLAILRAMQGCLETCTESNDLDFNPGQCTNQCAGSHHRFTDHQCEKHRPHPWRDGPQAEPIQDINELVRSMK